MCGITGFKTFSKKHDLTESLQKATQSLSLRGPDNQEVFTHESTGLGHTRLSIIDTSNLANQPMTDRSGRYTLAFNGEIYNYKGLAQSLNNEFISTSDTEVLLYLLIKEGEKCLPKLNGFFAFAFYDSQEQTLLIARDRMGIKPLHYFQNKDFFAFGSEMKALLTYPIERVLDKTSLYWYLRLTYLPSEMSMIAGVKKLLPGHYLKIDGSSTEVKAYATLKKVDPFEGGYTSAKQKTVSLLEQSVQRRMVADVPLGSFLSGGTDSSVIASLASTFNPNLNTFSIGYTNHPFFDETQYAELVANKIGTNHTTFKLSNDDLLDSLDAVINYLDEPFADSSAIPTYILSQKVSKSMKVALSGDGADELFGGYYKHLAFQKSNASSMQNSVLKKAHALLKALPQSRSSKVGNLVRRASKYTSLLAMTPSESYWRLASFHPSPEELLLEPPKETIVNNFMSSFHSNNKFDLNAFLDLDLEVVLPGDMLTKVDLMSMGNSLEVRVPFLDLDVVNFARSLPANFKVKGNKRKMVLQDAFEHILPKELHHRSKKGFEVPMLDWLKNELLSEIENHVFNTQRLEEQQLFNVDAVMKLRSKLFSNNPGDVHAIIWSLYVFQKWYMKYF